MLVRFCQLRRKEVINLCDGCRLGYVGDLEICLPEGTVKAIIVFGPCRFFGLFGRGEDYYIPWECVQKFGDDIVLIDKPFQRRDGPPNQKKRENSEICPAAGKNSRKNEEKYLAIVIRVWYHISVGIRTAFDRRPVLFTEG